jgi:hypothetical protein
VTPARNSTPSRRGRTGASRRRARKPTEARPGRIETPAPAPEPSPAAPAERETAEALVATAAPEPAFAARVSPPEPPRPLPVSRRAIFFDVENSSRVEHIARLLDHLAIDRMGQTTEVVAVGNWKVVAQDTARLLAHHGAHLVHSAPSTGVRDWSDMRIAVTAGVWLAGARAGDIVEIISDDQAFDAVGDVAACLGIAFRRLSYRSLAGVQGEGAPRPEPERAARPREPAEPHRRRGRRGGRGRSRARAQGQAPAQRHAPPRGTAPERSEAEAAVAPHTAPHGELVGVVRDLAAAGREVTLDAVANELKARGFRRPPGSPRLITRLRRTREIQVSPSGVITLLGETPEPAAPADVEVVAQPEAAPPSEAPPGPAEPTSRRRRRSRGGRGRRRRQPAGAA